MGKKRTDAAGRFDRTAMYRSAEAVGLVKSLSTASFDETVEVALTLGIDAKQADQAIRGTISLPSGTGKAVKVVVFADGDDARAAEEAGAYAVGGADLAAEVSSGARPIDWDVTIAHPSMMGQVGKLGRLLGPRSLMPNPKAGTVTPDIGKAVTEFMGGRVEYRNDRYGNVHAAIGKVSFEEQALLLNFAAVIDEMLRARPASAKGRFIRKVTISSTMGFGVKIDPNTVEEVLELVR